MPSKQVHHVNPYEWTCSPNCASEPLVRRNHRAGKRMPMQMKSTYKVERREGSEKVQLCQIHQRPTCESTFAVENCN